MLPDDDVAPDKRNLARCQDVTAQRADVVQVDGSAPTLLRLGGAAWATAQQPGLIAAEMDEGGVRVGGKHLVEQFGHQGQGTILTGAKLGDVAGMLT